MHIINYDEGAYGEKSFSKNCVFLAINISYINKIVRIPRVILSVINNA